MLAFDCRVIECLSLRLAFVARRPSGRSGSAEADERKRQFGSRIRQLRLERGLSQEAFAHAAGVHRTCAGSVERGEQNISLTNIYEFAAALGVPVGELFNDR